MFISNLQLTQFRNYTSLSADFCEGINCIVGPNGAGKTNILDAIHYLAFTRGFRNTQDKQAVQHGEQFFFNGGTLVRKRLKQQIHCNFVQGKGKKILINQKPISRMSEHIGRIPMIAMLPNDTELVNGPSQARRRFLDMLISQYDMAYLQHLIQYEKILAQRNALLKLFAEHRRFDADELSIWDAQLIPHGMGIYEGRRSFIESFQPLFSTYFHKIVSASEQPEIRYRSHIEENTPKNWQELLSRYREKDLANQYTVAGVHRDELVFGINGQSVRNYGSQGQQKTFVIALKLAQYQLLEQHTQLPPVLLLDDIFDKLDEQRLAQIGQILDLEIKGQTFITDTSQERLAGVFSTTKETAVQFFQVESGTLKPIDA